MQEVLLRCCHEGRMGVCPYNIMTRARLFFVDFGPIFKQSNIQLENLCLPVYIKNVIFFFVENLEGRWGGGEVNLTWGGIPGLPPPPFFLMKHC